MCVRERVRESSTRIAMCLAQPQQTNKQTNKPREEWKEKQGASKQRGRGRDLACLFVWENEQDEEDEEQQQKHKRETLLQSFIIFLHGFQDKTDRKREKRQSRERRIGFVGCIGGGSNDTMTYKGV